MKKLFLPLLCITSLFSINAPSTAQVIEDASKATVTIFVTSELPPLHSGCWPLFSPAEPGLSKSTGTGVIISDDGYIVTNHHVAQPGADIFVFFHEGTKEKATYIGGDLFSDIALLKVEKKNLSFLKWTDSEQVRVGDSVFAIGNPGIWLEEPDVYGLFHSNCTSGIVCAKNRLFFFGSHKIVDLIQSDVGITEGCSGGPLLNSQGELIGINTMGSDLPGFSFAISSRIAQRAVTKILEHGKVEHGYLGCLLAYPTEDLALLNNSYYPEAIIQAVAPGSPAKRAGLQKDDKVIAFDQTPIRTYQDLINEVLLSIPNASHTLKVLRDEETVEINITLDKLFEYNFFSLHI